MTRGGCDRSWERDVLREGRLGPRDVESFERHRRTCSTCAADEARDQRLRVLGRGLGVDADDLVLRRLRARVLREAATGEVLRPSSSWRRVAFASTLLAGFVAFSGLVVSRGALTAKSSVPAAAAPARATSAPAQGSAVAVASIEWAPRAEADAPGARAPVVAIGAPSVTTVRPVSPRAPEVPRDARLSATDVSGYVDAMRSFREGLYDAAAAGFHAFVLAHPEASQAEDASFLEAVALAQAGRPDAAALAAERHLESFPQSFRRKEASILVARDASRRARCDEARRALAPWSGEGADAEVRGALGVCRGTER